MHWKEPEIVLFDSIEIYPYNQDNIANGCNHSNAFIKNIGGSRMKYFNLTAGLLFAILAALNLNAQKLYTWTDENGVLHLTDQPPLETNKVENMDVIRYEEKSPQVIEAIERRKEILRRKLDKEEQIEKALRAEIQAIEAKKRAQETEQQAQEKYEYNQEYIRKLTSSKNKRKQFKQRVLRLKKEAEASLAEAKAAVEQADEAAQKAQIAAEEAKKIQ